MAHNIFPDFGCGDVRGGEYEEDYCNIKYNEQWK